MYRDYQDYQDVLRGIFHILTPHIDLAAYSVPASEQCQNCGSWLFWLFDLVSFALFLVKNKKRPFSLRQVTSTSPSAASGPHRGMGFLYCRLRVVDMFSNMSQLYRPPLEGC